MTRPLRAELGVPNVRSMLSRPRATLRYLSLLLLPLALLVAACGDDGGGDDSGTPESNGSPTADGDALEVEHRFGTTTIDETPKRVIAGDSQWVDVLLALDIPTVGHTTDAYVGKTFPWQDGLAEDSVNFGALSSWPIDDVIDLEPDLILGTWTIPNEATYESLEAIAPTIGPLTDRAVDRWEDMARLAGQIFDKEDEAQALIDSVDERIDGIAERLPGLEGKTFVLANYVEGDSLVIVADPEDGANSLFARLGLQLPDEIAGKAEEGEGRMNVSLERVDLLDADLVLVFSMTGDPSDLPGYDDLPAVKAGHALQMDYTSVVGLNTPSPLSLPYALDKIEPVLEDLAGS